MSATTAWRGARRKEMEANMTPDEGSAVTSASEWKGQDTLAAAEVVEQEGGLSGGASSRQSSAVTEDSGRVTLSI